MSSQNEPSRVLVVSVRPAGRGLHRPHSELYPWRSHPGGTSRRR